MATIRKEEKRLVIETTEYSAVVQTEGYVSGVAAGSFVDRKSGAKDPGFGLLIADFLLEPGSDLPNTPQEHRYSYGDLYHGNIAKRYVSLPQICTQAKRLPQEITEGEGFVAVRQWYQWGTACPPYHAGAQWEQHLLFPDGKRWFIGWDRFLCVDDVANVMMRMDMPTHIKHRGGDVFKQIYLSYHGKPIPQHAFHQNFAPHERFLYHREKRKVPRRYIRAIELEKGVWLAGMALDPASISEAWCHQRDYVCLIQEIGGRAVKAGEWTGAIHIIGYFDSIEEMEAVYDKYRGGTALHVATDGWRLTQGGTSLQK